MYATIEARGDDCRSFLQGQLTQDLGTVSDAHCPLAGWCTPEGRVLATFRLLPGDDGGYDLVMPAEHVDEVVAGLSRYRLRARVSLAAGSADWRSLALANAADLELLAARELLPEARRDAAVRRDGMTAVCLDAGRRVVELYGPAAALERARLSFCAPLSDGDWRAARIQAGIVDVIPVTSGRYTPHMLNLDRIGAVSFSKGCYTGQEIVARTEYRGSVKRRAARFRASAPTAVAEEVRLDGTAVGRVVATGGRELLAVLPTELHGSVLQAGDARLEPAEPG